MAKHKPKIQNTYDQHQHIFEIGKDAIMDQKFLNLPDEVQQELNQIYDQMSKQAAKHIPRLLDLKQQYPRVPTIFNYLSAAYSYVDVAKQEQAIIENYQTHPNNLFARCHYAQLCLRKNQPEKVPGIFENKHDLKAIYPRRNRFHPAEYAAFVAIMCRYFIASDQQDKAETAYQNLCDTVPLAVETQQLKPLMRPGLFKRVGKKIAAYLEA